MRGLALHGNLAGATFPGEAGTAPHYRLYSIGDLHPGMFAGESGGISVPGELQEMSEAIRARVEAGEPPHLTCGAVELDDGRILDGGSSRGAATHDRPARSGGRVTADSRHAAGHMEIPARDLEADLDRRGE